MAARIAGGDAFESGLVKIHAAGLLLDAYMNGQLGGLLAAGYRPPIAEGFARFLSAEGVAAALQEADELMRKGTSDLYDSHPSLKERLDALTEATHWPLLDPDQAATELLRNEPALEAQLLSAIGLDVWTLRPISWEEASTVYLDLWRKRCRDERAALDGITAEMLPQGLPGPSVVHRPDSSSEPSGAGQRPILTCGSGTHGPPVEVRLVSRGRAGGPRHGNPRRRDHHAFRGARSLVA